MARITPIPPRKLIKILKRFGFEVSRQEGSHLSMTKPGNPRALVIPMHPRDLPTFIIINNIKSAGISRDEYLKALSEL